MSSSGLKACAKIEGRKLLVEWQFRKYWLKTDCQTNDQHAHDASLKTSIAQCLLYAPPTLTIIISEFGPQNVFMV